MLLSEKIRVLRENRGWTQAELAAQLNVSESTVQKWEVKKSIPPLTELKNVALIFDTSIGILTDDKTDIYKLYEIGMMPAELYTDYTDSDHIILDAGLAKGAQLHRFNNPAGVPYSAIYIGHCECCSCERNNEKRMIDYWNE